MKFSKLTDIISKAGIEPLSFWYISFIFSLAIKLIIVSLCLYIVISKFKFSIEMSYMAYSFGFKARLRRGYNRVQDLLKRKILRSNKIRGRQEDLSNR